MSSHIKQALTRLFEKHRIIFWYDSKKELRVDYESLDIPDVEKVEITNNEFGLKYRVLKEQPDQKFLLYKESPQPADINNWLLDVQLSNGEFRTDQVALWLAELELGIEFIDMVQAHDTFFHAVKRKEDLKTLLDKDDTQGKIRLKMLAICAGSEPLIDSVLESLLAELSEGKDDRFKLITRCGLDEFLWEQMKRFYGYSSETKGVKDFVIELFKSCYAMGTDGAIKLTSDALVFLKRWKDSRKYEDSFKNLSDECADILSIEHDLGSKDFRKLIELDYFELIDKKIISDLVRNVAERTISAGDCALLVRQRRQSHWYDRFEHEYSAIDVAAQFNHVLDEVKDHLTMESITEGVQNYCRSWYRLDQLYRKYTYHLQSSGKTSLLEKLSKQMENLYSTNFLLTVNDNWQKVVDDTDKWDIANTCKNHPCSLQNRFFDRYVSPVFDKKNKIFVIISDALRYEIGEELLGRIRQEDRYEAVLESSLAMLPSYTQLGMAALLPNKEITLKDNDTGAVLVDGQSSQGIANRNKILSNAVRKNIATVKAEEFLGMNNDESRALVKDNDAIYIYHNRIDITGDKRDSEERVFGAVEETLVDLIKLIKKLTSSNANRILLTADHGFIYQNRAIDESDFTEAEPDGSEILYLDRRFIIGKGLSENSSLKKFTASQLGLSGDVEIQIPKSINRLRQKGSGSRFVHGGASLQEVVIPIIKINKKRQTDISVVDVDILRGSSSVITSGQLAVALYQKQPIADKVQSRKLRAGIYTQEGELISDRHELTFDLNSENPRERELQIRFVMTKQADKANEHDVILKLEEKELGTSHYKEYKSIRYLMRRSFTSDFDF
ncbi:MAG: BREX-1 system phosphatase PglZ type A [candidate division Zixibacteria bacterium]|nr:BREX-1 system phosphatase PglZ type A [candidate division Zixibacteria bacterium]